MKRNRTNDIIIQNFDAEYVFKADMEKPDIQQTRKILFENYDFIDLQLIDKKLQCKSFLNGQLTIANSCEFSSGLNDVRGLIVLKYSNFIAVWSKNQINIINSRTRKIVQIFTFQKEIKQLLKYKKKLLCLFEDRTTLIF